MVWTDNLYFHRGKELPKGKPGDWGVYVKMFGPNEVSGSRAELKYDLVAGRKDVSLLKAREDLVFFRSSKKAGDAGERLGYILYYLDRDKKTISEKFYFPVPGRLKGFGIATRAEAAILKDLGRRYKGFRYRPSNASSDARARQLRARGLEPGESVPIMAAAVGSAQKSARDIRKGRPKPGPKPIVRKRVA